MKQVKEIIASIKETSCFQQAFIHTSFRNEFGLENSYETLEFLGDSVLNFATSLFLYRSFPHFTEGEMSKFKQLMVCEKTLAYLSKKFRLVDYLQLGTVEKKNDGANKNSILADIFESFLAALYLERGEKVVHEFLGLTLFPWAKNKENIIWDYKSQLQEFCQAQKNKINYQVKETRKMGNKQIFLIEVRDELGTFQAIGQGKSKKEAEQQAAQKVVKKLGINEKSAT